MQPTFLHNESLLVARTVHVDHHPSDKKSTTQRSRSRRNRRKNSQERNVSLLDEKEVPSYKEFVHKFTVLSLYRGYLKTIRDSMPHNHNDLREQARNEFRRSKNITDPYNVSQAIKEGQRRFDELKEFIGESNKYEGTSWINIEDPDDPRGRVGTGWPWAKK